MFIIPKNEELLPSVYIRLMEEKNNVVVTWRQATELDLQLNIKVNEY